MYGDADTEFDGENPSFVEVLYQMQAQTAALAEDMAMDSQDHPEGLLKLEKAKLQSVAQDITAFTAQGEQVNSCWVELADFVMASWRVCMAYVGCSCVAVAAIVVKMAGR